MIPPLVQILGAPHRVLPPGIHPSSVLEIGERFATTEHRLRLFRGFTALVKVLKDSGCTTIYLDGSFASDKPVPNDYDGCWDPLGVDLSKLDPVLLDFSNKRAAQKRKYLGEMFVASMGESSGQTFLDFFQTEKNTGERKGILLLQSLNDVAQP
jgi:hypothetical protein